MITSRELIIRTLSALWGAHIKGHVISTREPDRIELLGVLRIEAEMVEDYNFL